MPSSRGEHEDHVAAEGVQLAVGEIHDAHDAEDERQADAEEGVRAAEHQRVDDVLEEFVHVKKIPGHATPELTIAIAIPDRRDARRARLRDTGVIERQLAPNATLPLSIFTTYTAGMLWPLSLPAGPAFVNAILPLTPVSCVFQSAARIASGLGLAGFRDRRGDGVDAVVAAETFGQAREVVAALPPLGDERFRAAPDSATASGNHGGKKSR